jgi:chemotaxis protein histidine kinase CheA
MSSKLEQKLAEFRVTFTAELNEKLVLLTKLWAEARTSQTIDAVKKFRFEVHSLRGASGALNFLTLSARLGIIEEEIAPCEEQINNFKNVVAFIDRHMNSMIEASKNNPNPLLILKEHPSSLVESREPQKNKEDISLQSYRDINIALIDDNQSTSVVNAKLLAGFGFMIKQYNSIEQFEKVLAHLI